MRRLISKLLIFSLITIIGISNVCYSISANEIDPIKNSQDGFPFVENGETSEIYVDPQGADYDGLSLVAESFAEDVNMVTGKTPKVETDAEQLDGTVLIAGSIGNNDLIDSLIAEGKLDVSPIEDKWETYKTQVVKEPIEGVDEAVVVAGSDKRGTIFGIYNISEQIGVSPWVYWGDVQPEKREELIISHDELYTTSKEPSVKYRGIFLNDEWPSLGSWVENEFGDFNEEFYEKVYQLLLRNKANYLWPAMWSAEFSEDGKERPIANAELADTYGIVMGTSHHEPMYRAGEEWQNVYEDYGDSNTWDFNENGEAITDFWEDGVIRNKDYENLITLGMRGEADSSLGGGVEENVDLLKDVITTQKDLLSKYDNEDEPQLFTIYKEVEEYWNGNDNVEGLKEWDVLNDVTVMLTDDNFGNMRTLPSEEERNREAGWGMYYHFDYHGGPRSYEWVNTVPIEKTWEQMSMAYDNGVQDVWIVNVGDLKPMELPISYFLDLAYDFEKWGTDGKNKTMEYTELWVEQQFGHVLDNDSTEGIADVLSDYTRMNGTRKPEITYSDTYSFENFNEAEKVLAEAVEIEEKAEKYYESIPEAYKDAYYQLVYYPAAASANIKKMQIYAGLNQKYFGLYNQSVLANWYAELTNDAIKRDEQLQYDYNNTMSDGKWEGMMSSPHIGYTSWNSEGWQYPEVNYITPKDGSSMVVDVEGTNQGYVSGTATLPEFTNLQKENYSVTISNGGNKEFDYDIEVSEDWIELDNKQRNVKIGETVNVSVDWNKISSTSEGQITITGNGQTVKVNVIAEVIDTSNLEEMTFVETHDMVSIEAEHTSNRVEKSDVEWKTIKNYGRTLSSEKMFPTTKSFEEVEEAPYLEYEVKVDEEAEYTLTTYTAPTNNHSPDSRLKYGVSFDNDGPVIADTLPTDFEAGDDSNEPWNSGVMENIRTTTTTHHLTEGTHTLRFYGLDAGLVLQKLVLSNGELPKSYFGPEESFYKGRTESVDEVFEDLDPDENYMDYELFPEDNMEPRWPDWGEGSFNEKDGQVSIEAEIALEDSEYANITGVNSHDWKKVQGKSYGALQVLPDSGGDWIETSDFNGNSPEISYSIDFSETGNYNVWILSKSNDYTDDSIHVGLDNTYQFSNTNLPKSGDFTWTNIGEITVEEDTSHDLNFWAREDGISVDKIYLTTGDDIPEGDGPEVSRNDLIFPQDIDHLDDMLTYGKENDLIKNQGIERSLQAKVKNIQRNQGDDKKTQNALNSFKNQIRALKDKQLEGSFADMLLDAIDNIEGNLNE